MNRARFILVIILVMSLVPRLARADATNHIVISEIQTGSAASSSQEFVELYNPTSQALSLDNWQVEYRPASPTSAWTNRTNGGLHGYIPADGFYLIAPAAYLPNADAAFSSGMAAGGGSLRLVDANSNVIDLVGWGTGVESEGGVAPAPAAGGSIERLPGETNPTSGNGIDTDNNSADFGLRAVVEPQPSSSAVELPGPVLSSPDPTTVTPSPDPSTPDTNASYSPVNLSELLVDPISPKTDARDEFIELFNPNQVPVTLTGYVIKTGSNFHDSYTLPASSIDPGAYLALYSVQTKLSLTNAGGAAELLDPSGNVIDQTAEYDGSLPGQSFSRFGSDWQWTTTLTPGAANIFTAPAAAQVTTKTATAKKVTAGKASVKTSKVKAPKAVKATKSGLAATAAQRAGFAGKWLIIGLAALTLGYAIYEFRYDLQNYYVLARRKYGAWREARASIKR